MKTPLLLTLIIAALTSWSPLQAQYGQQMPSLNSPEYEAAASRLRNTPPRQYAFSKANLSDVMRFMAEDAGIGFFGLPDDTDGSDRLVTFTLNASPFMALETLAKANGVSLIHDSGIWYLRPANDQELIGRIYEITYNAQELVTKNTQAGSISSSGGGGGGSGSSLSLQGSPDFFVTEPSRILEDIQNILDIPTSGGRATFAPTASVDTVAQLSLGGFQGTPDLVVRPNGGRVSEDDAGQSKVIWNSDSNTLYVVATRQQHQWIEAYLASADRPQPMISVEVKFLETRKDPTTDFGIDWDGATGDNGLELTLSDNSGPLNLDSIGGYSLPTAVLSYSDLNWKLRALYSDKNARAVSFPRMVTLDNREVSFRSVVNQPVLGSSASASLGAGATQTSSVEYLPIGTVINILPKRMANDMILLNVSVTISDIIGTEFINGNPFPIATSRVYTAPLTVKSGYTVAISGLDAARSNDTERGVPILGRIPVIGYAFKNRREDRNRQHLMMLITPVALDPGTEGLTKKPITREPWKKPPVEAGNYDYGKAPVYDSSYPSHSRQAPSIDEIPTFDSAVVDRKSEQTFGQREETDHVMSPAEAIVTERAPAANASEDFSVLQAMPVDDLYAGVTRTKTTTQSNSMQPVPSALNTPMVVEPISNIIEEPAPAPKPQSEMKEAPKADVLPKAEVAPKGDVAPKAEEVPVASKEASGTGGYDAIKAQVKEIKTELANIPEGSDRLSPDDGQMVSNAFEKAQSLLDDVDSKRGDDVRPLQGELGDIWWDLINVKTKALKLSRRSPQSLALGDDIAELGD
tara:strand:- start:851 stop:3268 length:2418 start_codon:yes stop_codon:yes gene_type:complete